MGTDYQDNLEASCSNSLVIDNTKFNQIEEVIPAMTSHKARCVHNQINIWENLLEIRTQLQQCLINSNKLSQSKSLLAEIQKQLQKNNPKFCETRMHVANILDKLLALERLLLERFPETNNLFSNQEDDKHVEQGLNVIEENRIFETLDNYENKLSSKFITYTPYRNRIIQKWSRGNHLNLTPSILNHNTSSNKHQLVKESEVKWNNDLSCEQVKCNNTEAMEKHDPEEFDDNDFYRKMLEEFIEIKFTNVADPLKLSRRWIKLNNIRRKMKCNIDTKATKGRKIRYTVHNKLVNFMAPINDAYMEGNCEIYNSLFGKNHFINK